VQTVGSQLREVRESLGIQLEEAANVTRIGKNYLIAIEEDTFDKLPSPAYVKGFLRVYAGFLGLSGDEIIALYDRTFTSQHSPQSPVILDEEACSNGKTTFPRSFLWFIPIPVLISIAAWIYFSPEKVKKMETTVPATVRQQTVAAPIMPVRSSAVRGVITGKILSEGRESLPAAAAPPPNRSGIILKLKVNQDCWLNITIDETVSQQYDLKAGDLIEWKGEKVFALDLGNAGGVEAELNGRPLASFGGQGKSAHVVLKGGGA